MLDDFLIICHSLKLFSLVLLIGRLVVALPPKSGRDKTIC